MNIKIDETHTVTEQVIIDEINQAISFYNKMIHVDSLFFLTEIHVTHELITKYIEMFGQMRFPINKGEVGLSLTQWLSRLHPQLILENT